MRPWLTLAALAVAATLAPDGIDAIRVIDAIGWPVGHAIDPLRAIGATRWPLADAITADRAALLDGQLWRLYTGPLRHADPAHLTRDLLGLLGLALMMRGRLDRRATAALIALGLPLPVVGALLGDPTLTGYYGLSGLVHALCVVALADLAATRPRWALPLAAALVAKLAYELGTGGLLVPLEGTRPAVWAHGVGAALGVVVGWRVMRSRRAAERSAAPDSGRGRGRIAHARPRPAMHLGHRSSGALTRSAARRDHHPALGSASGHQPR